MPESYVIFTGRPNAGKSTTIRALTGLKAPVGKQPGTTTSINRYQVSQGLFIIDMPGYGRRVSGTKRWEDRVKNLILDFIDDNRNRIVLTVHVLNILTFLETEYRLSKKGYINLDVEMVKYLHEKLGHFPLVAANKIDKGKEEEVVKNLEAFIEIVSGGNPAILSDYIFPLSAKTGIGVGPLKDRFFRILISAGFKNPFEYIR